MQNHLNAKQRAIIPIAAFTASGDLDELKRALNEGLDAGLTVNETKSILAQLYAYAGFPRSLNGINTLMAVLESRAKQGKQDQAGQSYQPIEGGDRYERGRVTLEKLTGVAQSKPAPGFGEFCPEIDHFLKEHLFADIFDNPVLNHQERELATIAALAAMEGVAPQLKAHIGMGKHTGLTDAQLVQVANLIEAAVNRTQANVMRQLLDQPEVPVIDRDMLVRISEIEIAAESSAAYLAILEEEARNSVEAETGVISIFPMLRADEPTQVRIVEIYRNRSAYEAHIASPHFQHYKTATAPMVKSLKLVDMKAIDTDTMPTIFVKLK